MTLVRSVLSEDALDTSDIKVGMSVTRGNLLSPPHLGNNSNCNSNSIASKHQMLVDSPVSPTTSSPTKPIKEKIVLIYDQWFSGVDPTMGNINFWDELFLLKANTVHLENLINHSSWERLCQLKDTIHILFTQSISTVLLGQYQIKLFNALQTLCVLISSTFKKCITEFKCDPAHLLLSKKGHLLMVDLVDGINKILTEEYPPSLKNLCFKLLLISLTTDHLVNENGLAHYFMAHSIFDSLKRILAVADQTAKHGHDALLLLTLLLNYKKQEESNPYIIQFSLLDDMLALNGLGCVISSALKELIQFEQKLENEKNNSGSVVHRIGSYITGYVSGSLNSDEAPPKHGPAFSSKTHDAILLVLYEAVNLNRNFISVLTNTNDPLTHPHSLFGGPAVEAVFHNLLQSVTHKNPTDSINSKTISNTTNTTNDGNTATESVQTAPTKAPANLMGTFLTYSSIVFLRSHINNDTAMRAKLCVIILQCLTEDHHACTLLHDSNMLCPVKIHCQPQSQTVRNNIKSNNHVTRSLPLAGHIIDLMCELLRGHLRKTLNEELCMTAVGIIHRLICYQKRNRIRIAYSWANLWNALYSVIKFILTHESTLLAVTRPFRIIERAMVIFNMFITYGDTFLCSTRTYDELYYEFIREKETFDRLQQLSDNGSICDTIKSQLSISLYNILAIVNHFVEKIDKYQIDNHLSSLSSDQVYETIEKNYEGLKLKLQENLHDFERYNEKNESEFFLQFVKSITQDFQFRICVQNISQKNVLQELSSVK